MDHSDASDISIEVFSNHFLPTFAVCLRFIRCGSWLSGRHCQCHRRQDRRDVVDSISLVPTQIWSTFILNMSIILRPLCREFNSL